MHINIEMYPVQQFGKTFLLVVSYDVILYVYLRVSSGTFWPGRIRNNCTGFGSYLLNKKIRIIFANFSSNLSKSSLITYIFPRKSLKCFKSLVAVPFCTLINSYNLPITDYCLKNRSQFRKDLNVGSETGQNHSGSTLPAPLPYFTADSRREVSKDDFALVPTASMVLIFHVAAVMD